ncbi:MAG: NAD+ synthase [Treponema sp.]|nr:NAD+ synthase [Treponema sp.]
MRIAIAQVNPVIGDFPGNRKKILDCAWKAKNDYQADLVLFSELSICGYPPLDLLGQPEFTEQNTMTLRNLQEFLPEDLAAGVGYVKRSPYSAQRLLNAYGIILGHELVFEQFKINITSHDYFDEAKYFEPGRYPAGKQYPDVFEYLGERIGIAAGEDARTGDFINRGISMLCIPEAVPFTAGQFENIRKTMEQLSKKLNIPVIRINQAGANDSIIFDGRSMITLPLITESNDECAHTQITKAFEEDLLFAELPYQNNKAAIKTEASVITSDVTVKNNAGNEPELTSDNSDELEQALVLGIKDYMKKCGFTKVHLGLSGGIDSALAAYLAAKAAGPQNVTCFNMPSRFSSAGSKDDSRLLAQNLGCRYEVLPIESIYTACMSVLEDVFEKRPFDVAEENLQARIRGLLWMGYANKFNSMLVSCGNKSELAMGYCTLYGDTNGALAPIGDLFKTEVISLCKRINERSVRETGKTIIPQAIIDKPPSAELRPNQTDQDSLPPYEVLDKILKLIIYDNLSAQEIIARGFDPDTVKKIYRTMIRSEWKRRQTPPVLRVSPKAFGIGRNQPLARAIFEI